MDILSYSPIAERLALGKPLDRSIPVFNVKDADFGAKGDGVTDDYAAIAAAIAAAAAGGGGTVFFPEGLYITAQEIDITSNVTIAGAGQVTTTVKIASAGGLPAGTPLRAMGTATSMRSDITIRDITVDGHEPTWGLYGEQKNGIWLRYVDRPRIERVTVRNCNTDGLILEACRYGVITGSFFQQVRKFAVYCSGSDSCTVSNNTTIDCLTGVAMMGTWYGSVLGNVCRSHVLSTYQGLMIGRDAHYITVTGNYSNGIDIEAGPVVGGLYFDADHPNHVTYDGVDTGGVVTGTIYGCTGCTIAANTFAQNRYQCSPGVGAYLHRFHDSAFVNNIVAEIANFGIDVVDSHRSLVSGNRIINCGSSSNANGIVVGGFDATTKSFDCVVEKNELMDTRTAGGDIMLGIAVSDYASGISIKNNWFGSWSLPLQYRYVVQAGTVIEFIPGDVVEPLDVFSTQPIAINSNVYSVASSSDVIAGFGAYPAPRQLTLLFTGSRTVQFGTNMRLAGSVDFAGNIDDVLVLRTTDGTRWLEVSRSVNS